MGEHWDLIVVGAGAAGLLAASRAAELGVKTLLLEKNRKPGVKILMSGGTRCNLTHHTDAKGIVRAFGKQGKFLHSALALLPPSEVVTLFENEGVATKVESTGKVFPVSNKALDVQQALIKRVQRTGATLLTETPVDSIARVESGFEIQSASQSWNAPRLLLTTGGLSYPGCGTVGDGFGWAKSLGHTIEPTHPALTPLRTSLEWPRALSGLTIPDVELAICDAKNLDAVADLHSAKRLKRALASDRGSFLFTHAGFSGPIPMNVSHVLTAPDYQGPFWAVCDFLPEVEVNEIVERLEAAIQNSGRKHVEQFLIEFLRKRLAVELLAANSIRSDLPLAELGKQQRSLLCKLIKRQAIPLSGTLGYAKAEVTAGGVSRSEVDSSTLQSKLVSGLYFAGEILDLDGPIGGYNFQSAFSTGWLAATKIAEAL